MKPVLLSGIQPSGHLMLGNYLGVVKQWVALQDKYHCLFPLVDLHAITVRNSPEQLRKRCYEFIALYFACGLDSAKSDIFIQSHVPQHSEVAWLLNCYTYMGELNRMTQFKDKSQRHAQNINSGLFSYPVLMAADILIYQANLVPVGEDQKQHLELCRNLAERVNGLYEQEGEEAIFTIPEPFILEKEKGGKIMALQHPEKKMSKSDDNTNNVIFLLDDPKTIEKKMKKSVTDSDGEIRYDLENKPGITNLLTIMSLVTDTPIAKIEQDYQNKGYGHLKLDLAAAVIEFLEPIQTRFKQLIEDKSYLNQQLRIGAKNAAERAEQTATRLKQAIGLIV